MQYVLFVRQITDELAHGSRMFPDQHRHGDNLPVVGHLRRREYVNDLQFNVAFQNMLTKLCDVLSGSLAVGSVPGDV